MSNSTSEEDAEKFQNDFSDDSSDEGISGPVSMFSVMKPYHVPGTSDKPHKQESEQNINTDSENEERVGEKRKTPPTVPPKPKKKSAQDMSVLEGAAEQGEGLAQGEEEQDMELQESATGEKVTEEKESVAESGPTPTDVSTTSPDIKSNFMSYVMVDGENWDKSMKPEADQEENSEVHSSCSDSFKSSQSDIDEEEFKDSVDDHDMTSNKDEDDGTSTPVGDGEDTSIDKEDEAPETLEDESNKACSSATSEDLSFVVLGQGDTFKSISSSISESALENQDTLQISGDLDNVPVDNADRESDKDTESKGGNDDQEAKDIDTENVYNVERRSPKEDSNTEEVAEKRLSVKDRIKLFQDNTADLPKRMSGSLSDSKSPSPETENPDPESNENMAVKSTESESNDDSNPASSVKFELEPQADDSTSAESFMIPESNDFQESQATYDTDGEEDEEEPVADDLDDVAPPCMPCSSSSMEDEHGIHGEATGEVDTSDVPAVADTEQADAEEDDNEEADNEVADNEGYSRNLDEPSEPPPPLPPKSEKVYESMASMKHEDSSPSLSEPQTSPEAQQPPPQAQQQYPQYFGQFPGAYASMPHGMPQGYMQGMSQQMPGDRFSYQPPQMYMDQNGQWQMMYPQQPYMYPQQQPYPPQQPEQAYGYGQPQDNIQPETASGLGTPFLSPPVETEPARLSPRGKSPVPPRVESPAPTGIDSPRTSSPHVERGPHKSNRQSELTATPTGRPALAKRQSDDSERKSKTKAPVRRSSSSPSRLNLRQNETPRGRQSKGVNREQPRTKQKGGKGTPSTLPEDEPSPLQHYIIVSNLDMAEGESYDNLSNYIQVGAGVAPVLEKIIYHRPSLTALLVLDGKPDMDKLKKRVAERALYEKYVSVQALQPPEAIAVSCEEDIAKESLVLYFENKKSGGGPIKCDAEDSEDKTFYIIRYKDPANVTTVCAKHPNHHFDGKSLRVSPYYEYPGGAIWDTGLHTLPIPGPVKAEMSRTHGTYLQNHCEQALTDHLKDQHCTFTIEESFVELTCTLCPGVEDFRRLLKAWPGAVQAAVRGFLEDNVEDKHLVVKDGVWDNLLKFLQSGDFDDSEIVVETDDAQRKITFTGATATVGEKLAVARQKHDQIDRNNKKLKATKQFESQELELALPGVQEKIMEMQAKYSDAEIKLFGATVEVEAVPEDKDQIYVDIYETLQQIQRHKIGHSYSEECVCYTSDNDAIRTNINNQIKAADIEASWKLEKQELVICITEGDYGKVRDIVFDIIEEQSMDFEEEDCGLLHDRQWINLQDDITEQYDAEAKTSDVTFNGKKGSLIVYGLEGTVKVIVKKINNFIEDNGMRKKSVHCPAMDLEFIRKHKHDAINNLEREFAVKIDLTGDAQIKLTGTRNGIEMGEPAVKQLMAKMVNKDHTIKKVAVIEVCRDSSMFTDVEAETKCLIKLPDEFEQIKNLSQASRATPENVRLSGANYMSEPVLEPGQSSGGITVSIVKDELGKQRADILVAATSNNLKLGSGAAGKNLVQVGGDGLQKECDNHGGIQHWEIAVINGGKLGCSKVYLTSLQPWSGPGSKRNLKKVVTDCLKMASQHSKQIISFAAMGTGALKYPAPEVASAMFQAVNEFNTRSPNTTLKEVRFVLHPKDKDTIRAFTDEEQNSGHGGGYTSRAEVTVGPMKVQLVVEKIEEQKVDCLLVATNEAMSMKSGACKALLSKGGSCLQDECKSKYSNNLKVGQVAEIAGGKLTCKSVYLTVLPPPKEQAEEELNRIVTTFLGLAQSKKYTSAAIPALGTGYLRYPKDVTCRGMYTAVANWAQSNPGTCLKNVRFVMFEKDKETIEVFQKKFEQRKGSGKGSRKFDHAHHKTGARFPMTRDAPASVPTAKITDKEPASVPTAKSTDSGCQIRQTILKVHIGDILESDTDAIVSSCGKTFNFNGAVAQMMLKKCPGIQKECHKKQDKFASDGLAVTGAYGLKARHIVHVQFQESLPAWKKIMVKSLEKADKKRLKTIAFPVLGSGGGFKTFKPENIAEQLFEALDEFTKKVGHTSVKDVRLVIFHKQSDMFTPVLKAIHRKANSTPASTYDKVKGFFSDKWDEYAGTKGVMTPVERQERREKMSSLSMTIYSDDMENIKTCKANLDERLEREYTTQKIGGSKDLVKNLTKHERQSVMDIKSLVDLTVDASTGIVTITGIYNHVQDAQSEIQELLRKFDKDRHENDQAETLHKQVVWFYEEITPTEAKLVDYDKRSNLKIEKAYNKSKDSVELYAVDGPVYIVDFKNWVEYEKGTNIKTGLRVVRKDVLKSEKAALPEDWVQMAPDENVKIVTIPLTDQRYKAVEQRFLQEVKSGKYTHRIQFQVGTLKVLKVEKIQNKPLFQQYHAKRKLIQTQKASLAKTMPLERDLWHGTNAGASSSIKTHGFNRSYCGGNTGQECWYGDGVYFAGDASYSARGWLSGADKTAQAQSGQTVKGYIFLVKVLTGQFCKGVKKMRFLQPVDPKRPDVLYDSAVDDVNNPFEFVIFHDTQCYPDYLIEFSATHP